MEDIHKEPSKSYFSKAKKEQKKVEQGRRYVVVDKKGTQVLARKGETDEQTRQRYNNNQFNKK